MVKLLGIRKAQKRKMLPDADLFPQVKYRGRKIDARAFGSGSYNQNLTDMQKRYFHSDNLPNVIFKPLTTAESLAVTSYNFKNLAKPKIFNESLQAGLALRVSDGIWINPLRDAEGTIIMNNQELKKHLDNADKVNGIYLFSGDTSFVPYDSFEQGEQGHEKFLEGGLGRGLVHTSNKKVTTLSKIANDTEYSFGVNIVMFDSVGVSKPLVRVVSFYSLKYHNEYKLVVDCYSYDEHSKCGYAFGGLVSGKASQ